jgi:phage tail sheath protein FI
MTSFLTPGVYLRQIEVAPPAAAHMSVTGFVGQAERGPLDSPQQVNNWGQYRDLFGDFVGHAYLPYSVFGFFLNGGERCYVVRVAHESARPARASFAGESLTNLFVPVEQGIDLAYVTSAARINVGDELLIDDGSASALVRVRAKPQGIRPVLIFDPVETGPGGQPLPVPFIAAGASIRELAVNIFAINPGLWGNGLTVSVSEASDPTIGSFKMVFRYRRAGRLVREEVFDNLSTNRSDENYFVAVINGEPEEADYLKRLRRGNSILARVEDLCAQRGQECAPPEKVSERQLTGGTEDPSRLTAAYFTGYKDGSPRAPTGGDALDGKHYGLAAFELVSEVGLVSIPDLFVPDFYKGLTPTQVSRDGIIFSKGLARVASFDNLAQGQSDMLLHCERMGDRFALFDSPRGAQTGRGTNKIEDWPTRFNQSPTAKNAALYYPWLREKTDDFGGRDLFIPPSGHVAGVCARAEREGGVGRAPANELLHGVVEFEFCVTDDEQDTLNQRGVNCLRSRPGRGQRIWGARTLSKDPVWRYVNVRRLCLFIIRQILVNLQWSIFEPNDRRLWNRMAATLTLFLNDMHKAGALAGDTAAQSFFVKCDEETNPPGLIDLGEVVTVIGFAPARPAEFVMVTVRRTAESVSVKER